MGFRTNCVKPSFPILKPSHSHSLFANSYFRSFSAAFDTSSFLRIFSTNAMCSSLVYIDTTSISFTKAFASGNCSSRVSITFWKSASIEVGPQKPFWSDMFPSIRSHSCNKLTKNCTVHWFFDLTLLVRMNMWSPMQ